MRFTYQNGAQPLAGYTIQRGIHRGGFGEVYFAQSDGGKEVALKLLHRQDQDVEIRGVTQCLNLKHPNLVNLFDLKTDLQGDHWVVMEYVSGSSLEDVLTSFPDGLPIAEVRDWLNGLVAGVAHLHDRRPTSIAKMAWSKWEMSDCPNDWIVIIDGSTRKAWEPSTTWLPKWHAANMDLRSMSIRWVSCCMN